MRPRSSCTVVCLHGMDRDERFELGLLLFFTMLRSMFTRRFVSEHFSISFRYISMLAGMDPRVLAPIICSSIQSIYR